jgi:hypothetical protein
MADFNPEAFAKELLDHKIDPYNLEGLKDIWENIKIGNPPKDLDPHTKANIVWRIRAILNDPNYY